MTDLFVRHPYGHHQRERCKQILPLTKFLQLKRLRCHTPNGLLELCPNIIDLKLDLLKEATDLRYIYQDCTNLQYLTILKIESVYTSDEWSSELHKFMKKCPKLKFLSLTFRSVSSLSSLIHDDCNISRLSPYHSTLKWRIMKLLS